MGSLRCGGSGLRDPAKLLGMTAHGAPGGDHPAARPSLSGLGRVHVAMRRNRRSVSRPRKKWVATIGSTGFRAVCARRRAKGADPVRPQRKG
jgi:hypothetical protein